MVNLYDIRTVSTPRAKCLAPPKPLAKPQITFAEAARRESRAMWKRWDGISQKVVVTAEAIKARHAEWIAALPEQPFNRKEARALWNVAEGVEGTRLDVLEREGSIRRVSAKPILWERCE